MNGGEATVKKRGRRKEEEKEKHIVLRALSCPFSPISPSLFL